MSKGMKRNQRLDSISLDETYYTEEGYLVDHPIVTTCGIFEYMQEDGTVRRELRLPEEVFSEKSLKSYKGKPIIITHDAREVDKENVRKEQIGTIMSEGYRDGDNVRCEIIIHDTNALKECGLKELSLGYAMDKELTPGTYQGEKYDCIQRDIEINHLALVGEARAGRSARLNIDGKGEAEEILKGGKVIMKNKNDIGYTAADGTELTPEQLEAAVALFKAQQAAGQAATDGDNDPEPDNKEKPLTEQVRENMERIDGEDNNMSPEDIIAAQKKDLNKLLEEVDRLQAANDMNHTDENNDDPAVPATGTEGSDNKKKTMNEDAVEKLVAERMDIYRMAEKLNLDGVEGLSVLEGRKRVIKAVNPKMNLDGKTESYINAAYDIAKQNYAERKSTDDQRREMARKQMNVDSKRESKSVSARKAMIADMTGGKTV